MFFGGRTSCFKNVKQEHKRPALFGYGSKQPLWFYLPSHSNKRARGEKLVNFRAENIIIIAEASSATSPPLFFTGETFLNKIKKKKQSLSFFLCLIIIPSVHMLCNSWAVACPSLSFSVPGHKLLTKPKAQLKEDLFVPGWNDTFSCSFSYSSRSVFLSWLLSFWRWWVFFIYTILMRVISGITG